VQPIVRPKVHDAYWRFAAERQEIFHRRVREQQGQLTDNPILQRYKFCNTYRASDRVSQYLIANVIYQAAASRLPAEDTFMRTVLFRLFSKESTWQAIEKASGGLRRATLDVTGLGDMLAQLREQQPIYTAAFILAAPSVYGHSAKHRNHLALVADMFRPRGLGLTLGKAKSLKEVFEALVSYPMIGPFLGYQIAIDLNYTEHLQFDENEFTVPGPGALRGIHKVFADPGRLTPNELIMRMVDRQRDEFDRLGLYFDGLLGRPLHAIDCQGLFCETDKYSRQAFPELKSNRVRIKQPYRRSSEPLSMFFPPKWDINHRLAELTSAAPTLVSGPAPKRRSRRADPTAQLVLST
jgi:hypothetical protein